MNAKKLNWIKSRQREYYHLFGEKLAVDFNAMNDVGENHDIKIKRTGRQIRNEELILSVINKLCVKHDVLLSDVKCRIDKPAEKSEWRDKYRSFMLDLSRMVMEDRLHQITTSRIINKNRTVFYHYYSEKFYYNEVSVICN